MDLLATVRKEGSRGGRGDFKWSDVQTSGHREHYLGHSLMAPVGRWQKDKDLSWYAKGDGTKNDNGEDPAEIEARERREEIKRIKEAEQDALARALGLPVPDRTNANMEPLGEKAQSVLNASEVEEGGETRGIGYDSGRAAVGSAAAERIEGNAENMVNEGVQAGVEAEKGIENTDDETVMNEVIATDTDQDLLRDIGLDREPDPVVEIDTRSMRRGAEAAPHVVM